METTTKWQSKKFSFLSEAKTFQRAKQKKGYKTKLEKYAGIAHPCSIVKWSKRI